MISKNRSSRNERRNCSLRFLAKAPCVLSDGSTLMRSCRFSRHTPPAENITKHGLSRPQNTETVTHKCLLHHRQVSPKLLQQQKLAEPQSIWHDGSACKTDTTTDTSSHVLWPDRTKWLHDLQIHTTIYGYTSLHVETMQLVCVNQKPDITN